MYLRYKFIIYIYIHFIIRHVCPVHTSRKGDSEVCPTKNVIVAKAYYGVLVSLV